MIPFSGRDSPVWKSGQEFIEMFLSDFHLDPCSVKLEDLGLTPPPSEPSDPENSDLSDEDLIASMEMDSCMDSIVLDTGMFENDDMLAQLQEEAKQAEVKQEIKPKKSKLEEMKEALEFDHPYCIAKVDPLPVTEKIDFEVPSVYVGGQQIKSEPVDEWDISTDYAALGGMVEPNKILKVTQVKQEIYSNSNSDASTSDSDDDEVDVWGQPVAKTVVQVKRPRGRAAAKSVPSGKKAKTTTVAKPEPKTKAQKASTPPTSTRGRPRLNKAAKKTNKRGPKKSNSRNYQNSQLSEKRREHNNSEKLRRRELKDNLDNLQHVIPTFGRDFVPKMQVLIGARQYIEQITYDCANLEHEKQRQLVRRKKFHKELRRLIMSFSS